MKSLPWLRRAGWLAALAALLATAPSLRAQEEKEAAEQSPLKKEEVIREIRKMRSTARISGLKYQLDLRLEPVSKSLNDQLDLKGEGVHVDEVGKDGPAEKAGIKANDVILAVGDKPIKDARDLLTAVNESEGKELSLKLMRAGKPMSITITPKKREQGDDKRTHSPYMLTAELEKMIKEKLKSEGVDMRMQLFQPGKVLPPGVMLGRMGSADLPDDLTVNIHKEGKKPVEIEVKRGDQTWNIKDDDLSKLPEDVRKHVEPFAHGGGRFLSLRTDGKQFTLATPATQATKGVPAVRAVPGAARSDKTLERRLEEFNKHMQEMQKQMDEMRKNFRERRGDRADDKEEKDEDSDS